MGCVNQNLAFNKPLSGLSVDSTITYGKGHYGVDGQRTNGVSTTDGAKLEKFGYKIKFKVDLKKVRKVRQIVAFQTGGYRHFGVRVTTFRWHPT